MRALTNVAGAVFATSLRFSDLAASFALCDIVQQTREGEIEKAQRGKTIEGERQYYEREQQEERGGKRGGESGKEPPFIALRDSGVCAGLKAGSVGEPWVKRLTSPQWC